MVTLLGVKIDSITPDEAYSRIARSLRSKTGPYTVVTPNPEICVQASTDPQYREILNTADLRLPDGIGVLFAAKIRGEAVRERVSGADLLPKILELCESENISLGCVLPEHGLSTKEDVARMIHERFPHLRVSAVCDTDTNWREQLAHAECIIVALGAPRQEEWISREKTNLPEARVLMAVGTSLDFLTGRASRAPYGFRKLGLEWFWRLLHSIFEGGDEVVPHRFWNRLRRTWTAVVIFPIRVLTEKRS